MKVVNRTGNKVEVTEVRCSEKQAPPIYVESDEDDIKEHNIDGDKGAGGGDSGDDGADCGNKAESDTGT